MHPFQEHRAHKVEKRRVNHILHRKSGGRVGAEETSGDESDGEIVRDGEHRNNRKSMFKGKSPAVMKKGGEVHGKTKKHRMDRPHRAHGGKVKSGKGKTIINVVVGKGDQQQPMAHPVPVPMPPPRPAMPPPGMPPGGPPGLAGGPPMPPGGMGGPPPMMPRKSGGKVMHASSAVAPAKVIGNKLARDEAAPGRGLATEKDGPGDKMPQNSLAWTDSAKNGTRVQHTDGKIDGPDIGRKRVITYNRGGKVDMGFGAHATAKAINPHITAGGRSGNARLQKAAKASRTEAP